MSDNKENYLKIEEDTLCTFINNQSQRITSLEEIVKAQHEVLTLNESSMKRLIKIVSGQRQQISFIEKKLGIER